MEKRLEGVQHLRVLGSAVEGADGGGASLGDVDQSRRGDDGGGRGAAVSWARTAAALMSARSTSVDAGTMAAAGGRRRRICRRVDGSRGGDSGGGRGCDLHVHKSVGDVVELSSGMADASAWSASMLLRVGGKETFGGWSPCLLSS
jgi:hypothetical protein